MQNKFVLIPGGTGGLGKATAIKLVTCGAIVTLVGRTSESGERAAAEVRTKSGGECTFLQADMAEMASVRRLAATYRSRFPRLDVLLHCVGTISMNHSQTSEGIETNFATNYLGRFLLTELLQDLIPNHVGGRIITVCTAGVQPIRFDFNCLPACSNLSPLRAYQQSQAANDVWGLDLAKRFARRGVAVGIVNPGIVATDIRRRSGANWMVRLFDLLFLPFAVPVETGAIPLVYFASAEHIQGKNGVFFGPKCKILTVPKAARSPEVQRALREVSERIAGLESST